MGIYKIITLTADYHYIEWYTWTTGGDTYTTTTTRKYYTGSSPQMESWLGGCDKFKRVQTYPTYEWVTRCYHADSSTGVCGNCSVDITVTTTHTSLQ